MMSPLEEDGLKEARGAENNTIISDSTLRNILPPQLNKMTCRYKVMCGCECFVFSKSMHSYLLKWLDFRLKQLNDRSHNAQNRGYVEISISILKPVRMQYDLIVIIIKIPLHTRPRQNFVHVLLNIMGYRTGDVCCVVVISTQLLF